MQLLATFAGVLSNCWKILQSYGTKPVLGWFHVLKCAFHHISDRVHCASMLNFIYWLLFSNQSKYSRYCTTIHSKLLCKSNNLPWKSDICIANLLAFHINAASIMPQIIMKTEQSPMQFWHLHCEISARNHIYLGGMTCWKDVNLPSFKIMSCNRFPEMSVFKCCLQFFWPNPAIPNPLTRYQTWNQHYPPSVLTPSHMNLHSKTPLLSLTY